MRPPSTTVRCVNATTRWGGVRTPSLGRAGAIKRAVLKRRGGARGGADQVADPDHDVAREPPGRNGDGTVADIELGAETKRAVAEAAKHHERVVRGVDNRQIDPAPSRPSSAVISATRTAWASAPSAGSGNATGSAKPPPSRPRRIDMVPERPLETTRSCLPSRTPKSPWARSVAAAPGAPAGYSCGPPSVPCSPPRSTETMLASRWPTTASGRRSASIRASVSADAGPGSSVRQGRPEASVGAPEQDGDGPAVLGVAPQADDQIERTIAIKIGDLEIGWMPEAASKRDPAEAEPLPVAAARSEHADLESPAADGSDLDATVTAQVARNRIQAASAPRPVTERAAEPALLTMRNEDATSSAVGQNQVVIAVAVEFGEVDRVRAAADLKRRARRLDEAAEVRGPGARRQGPADDRDHRGKDEQDSIEGGLCRAHDHPTGITQIRHTCEPRP